MADDLIVHGLPNGTYACRCPSGKIRIFTKPCEEVTPKELDAACRGSATLKERGRTLKFKFLPRDDGTFSAEVIEDED